MWKPATLRQALRSIPPGSWGVAVSGGADSTALLHLLDRYRCDLRLRIIHVDHELRGDASLADARFVEALAGDLRRPLDLFRRSEVESSSPHLREMPHSAERWRRVRLTAYAAACRENSLAGVLVAHHADDLAETLLLRLIRGNPRSGTLGLSPLRPDATVAGVRLMRPLLGVRRERLRRWLMRHHHAWREDPSNARDVSRRNRLRRLLASRPAVTAALLNLAATATIAEEILQSRLGEWERSATPGPSLGAGSGDTRQPQPAGQSWSIERLATLAGPVRRRALRRVLIAGGVPEQEASPQHIARAEALLDPAGPRAVQFPGEVRFRRRKGQIEAASRT